MGLFSVIGTWVNLACSFEKRTADARLEADRLNIDKVCSVIQKASESPERSGYMRSLEKRVEDMSPRQVERLLNKLWDDDNMYAIKAIYPTLEKLKLAYKDENGYIWKY